MYGVDSDHSIDGWGFPRFFAVPVPCQGLLQISWRFPLQFPLAICLPHLLFRLPSCPLRCGFFPTGVSPAYKLKDRAEFSGPLKCSICWEVYLPSDMFTVCCGPPAHRFCSPCLSQHVQSAIESGNVRLGCLEFVLKSSESTLSTNRLWLRIYWTRFRINRLAGTWVVFSEYSHMFNSYRISMGAREPKAKFRFSWVGRRMLPPTKEYWLQVPCPIPNCVGTAIPSTRSRAECITCPACAFRYCSLCQEMYHYRVTCAEYHKMVQEWYLWCQDGRDKFKEDWTEFSQKFGSEIEDYDRYVHAVEEYARTLLSSFFTSFDSGITSTSRENSKGFETTRSGNQNAAAIAHTVIESLSV